MTTIICRQADSTSVISNGSWTTNLIKPIEIKQGDSLIVSKTFIDTVSEADSKIIIENDILATLELYSYVSSVDHEETPTYNTEGKSYYSNDPARIAKQVPNKSYSQYSDGYDYIHCKKIPNADFPVYMKRATSITIRSDLKNGNHYTGYPFDPGYPVPLFIQAKDQDGKIVMHSFICPRKKIPITGTTVTIPLNIITDVRYGLVAFNSDWSWNNAGSNPSGQNLDPDTDSFDIVYQTIGADGGTFQPVPISVDIPILKGSYSAGDMVSVLNDGLQNAVVNGQISTTPSEFPLNPILKQAASLTADDNYFVGVQSKTVNIAGVARTTLTYLQQVDNINWWFGSSLLNLDFNEDNSTFYFKYAHLPLYDTDSSGVIFSSYYEDVGTSKNYYAGKNSGVAISGFSAVNNDVNLGNYFTPYDFWTEKLGFVLKDIATTTQLEPNIQLGGETIGFHSFLNYGNGICTTTGRPVLDALINKTTTPFIAQPYVNIKELIDLTTPAYATKSVLNPIDLLYGYFLVEVQGGFSTEMIGSSDITRNISAIINRYYSLGSYTSGASDSSLIYTHTSPNSLYLNSLNIRILDSDKNLASHLDSDNTIFIQIIPGNTQ